MKFGTAPRDRRGALATHLGSLLILISVFLILPGAGWLISVALEPSDERIRFEGEACLEWVTKTPPRRFYDDGRVESCRNRLASVRWYEVRGKEIATADWHKWASKNAEAEAAFNEDIQELLDLFEKQSRKP